MKRLMIVIGILCGMVTCANARVATVDDIHTMWVVCDHHWYVEQGVEIGPAIDVHRWALDVHIASSGGGAWKFSVYPSVGEGIAGGTEPIYEIMGYLPQGYHELEMVYIDSHLAGQTFMSRFELGSGAFAWEMLECYEN